MIGDDLGTTADRFDGALRVELGLAQDGEWQQVVDLHRELLAHAIECRDLDLISKQHEGHLG